METSLRGALACSHRSCWVLGAGQLGFPYEGIRAKYRADSPKRKCYSFSSDRKRMSTIRQQGGLSGAPVLAMSNRVIAQLRAALGPAFPIVGVGGILSAEDAVSKIRAGADLVQLYTGLIYRGPALVKEAALAIQAMRSL